MTRYELAVTFACVAGILLLLWSGAASRRRATARASDPGPQPSVDYTVWRQRHYPHSHVRLVDDTQSQQVLPTVEHARRGTAVLEPDVDRPADLVLCATCNGSGKIADGRTCVICGGSGEW